MKTKRAVASRKMELTRKLVSCIVLFSAIVLYTYAFLPFASSKFSQRNLYDLCLSPGRPERNKDQRPQYFSPEVPDFLIMLLLVAFPFGVCLEFPALKFPQFRALVPWVVDLAFDLHHQTILVEGMSKGFLHFYCHSVEGCRRENFWLALVICFSLDEFPVPFPVGLVPNPGLEYASLKRHTKSDAIVIARR